MQDPRSARKVSQPPSRRRGVPGACRSSLVALLLVLTFASLALLPVTGAPSSDGALAERPLVRTVELTVPSFDDTPLSVRVHYPSYLDEAAASRARPVVLGTHGWGDNKDQLDDDGARLAGQGLILVAYDSRGYGNSGGAVGLNGPDEVADVSALIDWIGSWHTDAANPAVPRDVPPVLMDARDDGEADPRLGMIGISYAGAIQFLAALEDDRIDAIVPEITWSHLGTSLNPNDVVKQRWLDLLFFGGTTAAHADNDAGPDQQGLGDELASWYVATHSTGRLPPDAIDALEARSPLERLPEVQADVLLIQGWRDTLFPASQAVDAWHVMGGAGAATAAPPTADGGDGPAVTGGTSTMADVSATGSEDGPMRRLLIHDGGHGAGLQGRPRDLVDARQDAFLVAALQPADPTDRQRAFDAIPPVTFLREAAFDAAAWPPHGTRWQTTQTALATTADGVTHTTDADVVLRQTGTATSHTETPNFEDRHGTGAVDAPLPVTAWFTLDLRSGIELAGRPHLRLTADATVDDAPIYVSLVMTSGPAPGPAAAQDAAVVDGQVVPHRIPADGCDPCVIPLHDLSLALPLAAQLHVRVTTADTAFANARQPATITIPVDGVALDVPVFDADAAAWAAPEPAVPPAGSDARATPGPMVLPVVGSIMAALALGGRRDGRR